MVPSFNPSVLGCQLQLGLHLHQWPSMASHSAKFQLSSGCLYAFKSTTTLEIFTHTILAISGTEPLCALSKHFPEDFTSVMLVSS